MRPFKQYASSGSHLSCLHRTGSWAGSPLVRRSGCSFQSLYHRGQHLGQQVIYQMEHLALARAAHSVVVEREAHEDARGRRIRHRAPKRIHAWNGAFCTRHPYAPSVEAGVHVPQDGAWWSGCRKSWQHLCTVNEHRCPGRTEPVNEENWDG